MAYVIDPLREDETETPKELPSSQTPVRTTDPAPAPAQTQPQQQPQAPAQAASKHVNFDRIFNANKAYGTQKANEVATKIRDAGTAVQNRINTGVQKYTENVQSAVPNHYNSAAPYAYSGPQSMSQGGGIDTQGISTDIARLNQQLNATNSTAGIGSLAGTRSGIGSAIIAGAGSGLFEKLRTGYSGLGDSWQSTQSQAIQQAKDAEKQVADLEVKRQDHQKMLAQTAATKQKNDHYEKLTANRVMPEWKKKLAWEYVNNPEKFWNMPVPSWAHPLVVQGVMTAEQFQSERQKFLARQPRSYQPPPQTQQPQRTVPQGRTDPRSLGG